MEDERIARENVKRLSRLKGLTIKALAEAAGLSSSTLYNWLKDSNPNSLGASSLAAIAEALDVLPEHLFYTGGHGPTTDEEARQRALRQIDSILAAIDDPDEQDRAASLILATLRAFSDGYERQRAARPGARKAAISAVPSPTARHPRADG